MPDQLKELITHARDLPPEAAGVLLAMFMSIIRVFYDQEETKPARMIMEAIICGGLSLTMSFGIRAMGLADDWAIFFGGVIGYFGSIWVRAYAIKVLDRKVGVKGD